MIIMDHVTYFHFILHCNFALFNLFSSELNVGCNFINCNMFWSCTMHSGVNELESFVFKISFSFFLPSFVFLIQYFLYLLPCASALKLYKH
jgi:hypothetical protein